MMPFEIALHDLDRKLDKLFLEYYVAILISRLARSLWRTSK